MDREGWLDDAVARARAAQAWRVPEPALRAFLAEKLDDEPPAFVDELYLVLACAHGDTAALAVLERDYLDAIPDALVRGGAGRAQADEATQTLRVHLLGTGQSGRVRLLSYAGRGDLRGWLRVGATRELVRILQLHKRDVTLDTGAVAQLAGVADDPASQYLRTRHAADLKAAFAEATAALTSRQRRILRYQVLERLSIDEIGRLCRVHRATAARWLVEARDTLIALTRMHLAERLKLAPPELDSVIRAVDREVDLSLERLLDHDDRL